MNAALYPASVGRAHSHDLAYGPRGFSAYDILYNGNAYGDRSSVADGASPSSAFAFHGEPIELPEAIPCGDLSDACIG